MILDDNQGYLSVKELLSPFTVRQFKLWAMNPDNIHRGNAVNGEYYAKHRKYVVSRQRMGYSYC